MTTPTPVTMLVSYHPKAGREAELQHLVEQHYPTLAGLGLVTDTKARVWKAQSKGSDRPFFVELFQWRDAAASGIAHQTPEVMAVWETMGPVLEKLELVELQALA
jgi:hypothetical protein